MLFLILAGLIALAVYEPGNNITPVKNLISSIDPDKVQHLRLQIPERADVTLTKIEGVRQMLTPYTVAANQQRVRQIVKIVQAKGIATYPVSQTDINQLQLDAPGLILSVNDTPFLFGGTDALGGSRYVQIGDTIHLITDRYSHLARVDASQLVMPTLLSKGAKITALELPAFKLILSDGQWRVEQNGQENGVTSGVTNGENNSRIEPETRKVEARNTLQNINPDHLQQFLDQWRYARAFTVQVLDKNLTNTQTIHITTPSGSVQYSILNTNDEFIVQRHDLNLQYHFPLSTGEAMLTLEQTPTRQ